MLTDEQAANKIKEWRLNESLDVDDLHMYMDNLLCNLLMQLGYKQTADMFMSVEKWYD